MVTGKSINYINKFLAQKKMCALWFIYSFVIILIFVTFTITNRFNVHTSDAWQWLLQQIVPVLTLMVGVFVNSSHNNSDTRKIKKFYFRLAIFLSLGYLVLLTLTILSIPFAYKFTSMSAYDFLKRCTVYLIPFLGIATASLGIFFTKEEA
jgi:hypothetical protein